jgi:hypothetical protein
MPFGTSRTAENVVQNSKFNVQRKKSKKGHFF